MTGTTTVQAASETRPDWTPAAAPIEIRPLTPHIGAEIEGVDLSQPRFGERVSIVGDRPVA